MNWSDDFGFNSIKINQTNNRAVAQIEERERDGMNKLITNKHMFNVHDERNHTNWKKSKPYVNLIMIITRRVKKL